MPSANKPNEEDVIIPTGARKMHEVERETDPNVVALIPRFLDSVDQKSPSENLYKAMQDAVEHQELIAKGPDSKITADTFHHVTDTKSFYDHNILDSWKRFTAFVLGVSITDDKVYEAWITAVTNGSHIPEAMVDQDSTGTLAYKWWSPDERMASRPSSATREQADDDFFYMCQVVSLAPEWYPRGLVRINFNLKSIPDQGKRRMIRPVSFDGMESPLWVQHPPNQIAHTGDDAEEALNASEINMAYFDVSQAYVITPDLMDALHSSPSVNDYSPDLSKVSSDPRLGEQQKIIVTQVREARKKANQAFQDYFAQSATLGTKEVQKPAMARPDTESFPSDRPADEISWKATLEKWGRSGFAAGLRFPSEHVQEQINQSKEDGQEIMSAATELARESTDPGVLNLVAQLQRHVADLSFYQAIFDRIESNTPPIPEANGIRTSSVRRDLLTRLTDEPIATDPALADKVHDLLNREGMHDLRLDLLHQHDPNSDFVDALHESVDSISDIYTLAITAAKIAQDHPERLEETMAVIAPTAAKITQDWPNQLEAAVTAFAPLQKEIRAGLVKELGSKLKDLDTNRWESALNQLMADL